MSNLKVLEKLIDTSVFQQDNYRIPELHMQSVDACCEQLKYALLTRSKIFIYGDYDVDGLMSMLVWKSVFRSIGYTNYTLYQYSRRTHAIPNDILEQVKQAEAQYVIICDTGSGVDDRIMIRNLRALQMEVIVIDHHSCEYGYTNMQKEAFVFNSYEERAALGNDRVSGAYASLLVANVLCSKYLNCILSSDATYFALASMYSDIIDMSSKTAIALYNSVILHQGRVPNLFMAINKHNYKIGRRFFQYIVSPALNNCFRSGEFVLLNKLVAAEDSYTLGDIVNAIMTRHEKTRQLVKHLATTLKKETYGAITFCVYENQKTTNSMDLSGYTGLIANMVASEVGGAVVVITEVDGGYKGSLRDQQGRNFLTAFSSFADVGGHPPAFGIRVAANKYDIFKKSLEILGNTFSSKGNSKFTVISSEYITDQDDLNVLALYNEFMNTRDMVYVQLHCTHVVLQRKTAWYKYYRVGLPVPVKTVTPLLGQSTILLEPCIGVGVELREVVL